MSDVVLNINQVGLSINKSFPNLDSVKVTISFRLGDTEWHTRSVNLFIDEYEKMKASAPISTVTNETKKYRAYAYRRLMSTVR